MTLKNESKCDFCEDIDTLEHRFVKCAHVAKFWRDFETWWNAHNPNIQITEQIIMLGLYHKDNYTFNHLVLKAKYYIHKTVCNQMQVCFPAFRTYIQYHLEIEKTIFATQNKLDQFHKHWNIIIHNMV